MTFIHQNKHYHVIYIKNWHNTANKSPLLQSYLHTVNLETYTPQYPLCLSHTHDTIHLFNCNQVPTQHNTTRDGQFRIPNPKDSNPKLSQSKMPLQTK